MVWKKTKFVCTGFVPDELLKNFLWPQGIKDDSRFVDVRVVGDRIFAAGATPCTRGASASVGPGTKCSACANAKDLLRHRAVYEKQRLEAEAVKQKMKISEAPLCTRTDEQKIYNQRKTILELRQKVSHLTKRIESLEDSAQKMKSGVQLFTPFQQSAVNANNNKRSQQQCEMTEVECIPSERDARQEKVMRDLNAFWGKIRPCVLSLIENDCHAKCEWEGCEMAASQFEFESPASYLEHIESVHYQRPHEAAGEGNRCRLGQCSLRDKKYRQYKQLRHHIISCHVGQLDLRERLAMLEEGFVNMSRAPTGHRFGQATLSSCLKAYRSRSQWAALTKLCPFPLPCADSIRSYKNWHFAQFGVDHDNLSRMVAAFDAAVAKLPTNSPAWRYWAAQIYMLNFDEMNILPEVSVTVQAMNKNTGKIELLLATHIMQFRLRSLFLDFEWYVCATPTRGNASSDFISQLVKEIRMALRLYGFQCLTVVCDGASSNRRFQNLARDAENIASGSRTLLEDFPVYLGDISKPDESEMRCIVKNPIPETIEDISGEVRPFVVPCSLTSDPSHEVKKLRNAFNGKSIPVGTKMAHWTHLQGLYKYDTNKPGDRMRYTGLTKAAVNPSKADLMRNGLAFAVFSDDVLGHMNQPEIRQYLEENWGGSIDGTIEYLTACNIYMTRVLDHVPIRAMENPDEIDPRIAQLLDVVEKFKSWFASAGEKLMTQETFADLQHCAMGALACAEFILSPDFQQLAPGAYFIFCLLSQDSLERYFSKIRGGSGFGENPTPTQFLYIAARLHAQAYTKNSGLILKRRKKRKPKEIGEIRLTCQTIDEASLNPIEPNTVAYQTTHYILGWALRKCADHYSKKSQQFIDFVRIFGGLVFKKGLNRKRYTREGFIFEAQPWLMPFVRLLHAKIFSIATTENSKTYGNNLIPLVLLALTEDVQLKSRFHSDFDAEVERLRHDGDDVGSVSFYEDFYINFVTKYSPQVVYNFINEIFSTKTSGSHERLRLTVAGGKRRKD